MTARHVLNGMGKAFKWTVIGGLGGWAIGAMIYTFVVTPLCFPLVVAVLLMGFMGITLFALAGVSLYDLAQGNTDFSWFSLNDLARKPETPAWDVVEPTHDLALPPTRESSPSPVIEHTTPGLADPPHKTMPIVSDQTAVLEPSLRKLT